MNTRLSSGPWSVVLISSGTLFLISILVAFGLSLGESSDALLLFLAQAGLYLFTSFHLASVYLPTFLIGCGILLGRNRLSTGRLAAASLSVIPSLSLAVVLRILFTDDYLQSPICAWFIDVFAPEGAIAVSSIFTLFSAVLLSQLPRWVDTAIASALKKGEAGPNPGLKEGVLSGADIRQDSWFYLDGEGEAKAVTRTAEAEATEAEATETVGTRPGAAEDLLEDSLGQEEKAVEALALQEDGVQDPESVLESVQEFAEEQEEGRFYGPGEYFEEDLLPDLEQADFQADLADDLEDGSHNVEDSAYLGDPERADSPEAPEEAGQSGEEELKVFFSRGRLSGEPMVDTGSAEFADDGSAEARNFPASQADYRVAWNREEEEDLEESYDDEIEIQLEEEFGESAAENDDPVDESILPPPEPVKFVGPYDVPIRGILDVFENEEHWQIDKAARDAAEVLQNTLKEFGIQAEVTGIRKGPVITMFEILPAPGVKLQRIVNLADNIALRLAAQSVRIVAPIPGKHAVGIEIPNKNRHLVGFAELLQDPLFHDPRNEIPVALGKDITGDAQIVDLTKTPHLLIAGATGSGKSVCVNSLVCSVLYKRSPEEVRMVLIDPKIVELKLYNDIPHLLTPVITDPKKAYQALQWCIYEMERRYSLLDALAVRDIKSYNKKIKAKQIATTSLPYIVVVVDEFADLMATTGKELESTLARLAAMSRAVGIHLVLATQRPSTDVITGLIKANIPSRIAFMVASKVDSRIILDSMGAEKLLGRGDMLFASAWNPFPVRIQGAFLSEEEVERVVSHVRTLGRPDYIDDEIFIEDDEDDSFYQQELEDPLMEKAIEIVVSAGKASASYLQRRLKIGYNRAARLVEELEEMGIVGPQQGSRAREILRNPDLVR